MKIENHLITTVLLVTVSYLVTRSWQSAIGLFIGGVLIDLDHFVEFWYDNGLSFNMPRFFAYGNKGINSRYFIFFHSYELLIILLFIAYHSSLPLLFYGVIIGMSCHLLIDYINIVKNLRYRYNSFFIFSFIFRSVFKYNREAIDKLIRYPV